MTIQTLFGEETITPNPKSIKFKTIKAIYETLTIKEEIGHYFEPGTRFASPAPIFNIFSFLGDETERILLHQ